MCRVKEQGATKRRRKQMDTRPDTQCGHRACIAPTAYPVTFGVKATIRLPLSLRGTLVVDPVSSCPHRTRAVPKLGDFGTLKLD
jgi:hypothetical protein